MAIIKNSNIVLSSDIGSVLNAAGGSVNINQPATFFSADAKINMWSKRKPVDYNKLFDMTEDDYRSTAYGLTISSRDSQGHITFGYNMPKGTITSPYRLEDFKNYDTDASEFAWEKSNYTYDLDTQSDGLNFKVASSLTRITPNDLKTTLFSGCEVQIYATGTNYNYLSDWSKISNVTDWTWNVPKSELSKLGINNDNRIHFIIKFPDGFEYSLFRSIFRVSSSIADSIYFNELRQGLNKTYGYTNTISSGATLDTFQWGGGSNTIDFKNSSYFYFRATLFNNSSFELSPTNVMALLTYTDTNSVVQTVRCPIYNGSSFGNWTLKANSSWGGFAAAIRSVDVPNLWSSNTVRPVGFVVQANINGVWLDITQRMTLRMIKY